MDKQLLQSSEDWENWKNRLGCYSGIDKNITPKSYPCIVLWAEWDQGGTHWDGGCHGFVYPENFNA